MPPSVSLALDSIDSPGSTEREFSRRSITLSLPRNPSEMRSGNRAETPLVHRERGKS